MSNPKMLEKGVIKKKFQFDVDSSDDEHIHRQHFNPKSLQNNYMKFLEEEKMMMTEELGGEVGEDLDLSDMYLPKKRIRLEKDHCKAFCPKNCPHRVKATQKRYFWTTQCRVKELAQHNYSNRNVGLYMDEDSSSEYLSEVFLDKIKKPEDCNFFDTEGYLFNYKALAPDFCEEETVEESTHIKDVKPYLQDSDLEDIRSDKRNISKFDNQMYIEGYSLIEKMIE